MHKYNTLIRRKMKCNRGKNNSSPMYILLRKRKKTRRKTKNYNESKTKSFYRRVRSDGTGKCTDASNHIRSLAHRTVQTNKQTNI